MEENDLISKKELLQLTGISYGQLYRWKRENLIPEAWFIKKASFTGQETFFPREKILKRTSMILELKDKYSLEELAKILSPELTGHSFSINELEKFTYLDKGVLSGFKEILKKEYFTFMELMFIYIISKLRKESIVSEQETLGLAESVKDWLPKLKDNNYNLLLFVLDKAKQMMLVKRDAHVLLDSRTAIIKSFDLEEVSKDLNLMFNDEVEGF